MSKEKSINRESSKISREATALCESWGRWATGGDEARNIGKLASTLRISRSKHSGMDDIGVAVDEALSVLPEHSRLMAVLVFKHGLPNDEARQRLGLSQNGFDQQLSRLKWAVYVGVKIKMMEKKC